MKTINALFLSLSIAAVGCGWGTPKPKGPVEMVSTDPSAAAQGKVHVTDAGSGNAHVVVEIHHVPSAAKTAPGATTYVVWAHPVGGKPMNLGALKVNSDLTGELRTLTPMKHFDLFITAESSPEASAPSSVPVLSARIDRD